MPLGNNEARGLQLWINLSSENKMMPPKNKLIRNESIPIASKHGIVVKIIFGETMNISVCMSREVISWKNKHF